MIRSAVSARGLSLLLGAAIAAGVTRTVAASATVQDTVGNVFRVEAFPSVTGLEPGDEFGASAASLGDLDGDGVDDWLIGAPGDDDGGVDRGAVYFLYMNENGTLRTQWKISDTVGGFGGYLLDRARFGYSVANVGDLDGDGVPEVAVGAPGIRRVWVLFLRPNGTFSDVVELDRPSGHRAFGFSLTALGDLDGDGDQELACGDPMFCPLPCVAPSAGATFVYFLEPDGSTNGIQTITQGSAGFPGVLASSDFFGAALSSTNDLDSDGLRELIVSTPGAASDRGNVWLLYLGPDASVTQSVIYGSPLTQHLGWGGVVAGSLGSAAGAEVDLWAKNAHALFGYALDASGTISGGGMRNDSYGHGNTCWSAPCNIVDEPASGFLWDLGTQSNGVGRLLEGRPGSNLVQVLVHSSPDASWEYRNGSGTNEWILANLSQPRIGASWDTNLNCISHSPSTAFLFMYESPSLGPTVPAGQILVDTLSQRYLLLAAPHAGTVASFSVAIPNITSLCALRASVQGVCLGAPGMALSNAIDIQIGL